MAGTARTALVGGALIFPHHSPPEAGREDKRFPELGTSGAKVAGSTTVEATSLLHATLPLAGRGAWNDPTACPPGNHGAVQGSGKPWMQKYELGKQTCSQELGTETPCGEPPSALSGDYPGGWLSQ